MAAGSKHRELAFCFSMRICYVPKSPQKPWQKSNFVEDELYSQQQGRAIDQLDGARNNVDDQMMPVRQRSRDCVMSWRG